MILAKVFSLLLLAAVCYSQVFSYLNGTLQPVTTSPNVIVDNADPPAYIQLYQDSSLQVWDYPGRTLVDQLYNSTSTPTSYITSVFSSDYTWLVEFKYNYITERDLLTVWRRTGTQFNSLSNTDVAKLGDFVYSVLMTGDTSFVLVLQTSNVFVYRLNNSDGTLTVSQRISVP
jgi:hypothetical protein